MYNSILELFLSLAWFKEYCDVKRENGVPVATLYKYESEKYPGHFIRWYHDGSQSGNDTIDCEVAIYIYTVL